MKLFTTQSEVSRGGSNPPGEGANIQFCQIFPKNCMKLRKFWSGVGVVRAPARPPLDPPLVSALPAWCCGEKQETTMNDKKYRERRYISESRLPSLNYNVERDESFPVKIELISGAVSAYFEKTYRTRPKA